MAQDIQPVDDDGADLPLTESELIFFERVLSGEAPAAAFAAAYDVQGWAPGKVYRLAMRLRNSPKVVAALASAKEAGAGSSVVTMQAHLRELELIRDRATDKGNDAVALRAEELRGKVAGLYVEKHEVTVAPDPVAVLRKMAAFPALAPFARELAKQHGIAWATVEGKVIALRSD